MRNRWRLFTVLSAALVGALLTGLVGLAAPAPASAAGHRPVIFVHGLSGGAKTVFGDMVHRFQADGWSANQLFIWEYDWKQPNITTARQLAGYVDQVRAKTGASQVDIVAHSMGSLSSRYYLKFLGGQTKVVHWVSIGGVNHGTIASFACPWHSCPDMHPNSDMLKQLNGGDETPGAVRYQTQSSTCDEIAVPHSTVPLTGADNRKVGCLEHIKMPQSQTVYTTTRDFLKA